MVRAFRNEECVECGEETFTLAVDITIIDALEDEFDLPLDELMKQFEKSVRIGKLARLLRGLLSRHHPELTLDEIGTLLLEHNERFYEAMGRLFDKATPAGQAKDGNPPNARHATGASSSRNGAQRGSRRANTGRKHLERSS